MTEEKIESYIARDWHEEIVWLKNGFTDIPVYDFAEYLEFGLTIEEVMTFARMHCNGTQKEKAWIEDLFEEINFHKERRLLCNGQYRELEELTNDTEYIREFYDC